MSKEEDLTRIRQIIGNARDLERRRVEAERIDQFNRKERENRERIEAEKRLRETGIIDLLESMRDQGIVKSSDAPLFDFKNGFFGQMRVKVAEYCPAKIEIQGDYARIMFNDSGSGYDFVGVSFKNNVLVVSGREEYIVGRGLSMAEAVAGAILHPCHVKDHSLDKD